MDGGCAVVTVEKCPERVHSPGTFSSHRCDRPVKRDGLCGIHAAAADKRARAAEEYQRKAAARDAVVREASTEAMFISNLLSGVPVRVNSSYRENGSDATFVIKVSDWLERWR